MRMWKQVHGRRWISDDGAVVCIDETREGWNKVWSPNYRGYIAFGPGEENHNYLSFRRKNSVFVIPKKFKTPQAAMAAVDHEYPPKGTP